jgi:catechol 2,3-dioxygenase-like lactoylglutathione lyase family enzyme
MAKIRHIALATKDPDKTAEFYKKAFGFTEIRRSKDFTSGGGVFLTDGTLGIAILKFNWDQLGKGLDYTGLHHFGVVVDDTDDWTTHLENMGAELLVHSTDEAAKLITAVPSAADFEVKFKGPEGLVFDISEKSWPGAEAVDPEEKKIPVGEKAEAVS